MSNSDIIDFIESTYGVQHSTSQVSIITNPLLEDINYWHNRPLEDVYHIVWIDAIDYKTPQESKVISKACMIVLGVNTAGQQDILSMNNNCVNRKSSCLGVHFRRSALSRSKRHLVSVFRQPPWIR